MYSSKVQNFPLEINNILHEHIILPANFPNVLYHYTNHLGISGILRSGGLRATYRGKMSDSGEFTYARKVINKSLEKISKRDDLPNNVKSIITYSKKNFDKFLNDTTAMSSSYCACLTEYSDQPKQWEMYGENGRGFAIGFDLHKYLIQQKQEFEHKRSFVYCARVIYDEQRQNNLVEELIQTGIKDLQSFSNKFSMQIKDISCLRDRITCEIFLNLFTISNFIKNLIYSSERETRLFMDSNNETLNVKNIQCFESCGKQIPFIFIDFYKPKTKQIPIVEIKVGPKSFFPDEKAFLDKLLAKYSNVNQIQIINSDIKT